jgi:hypothetical protein
MKMQHRMPTWFLILGIAASLFFAGGSSFWSGQAFAAESETPAATFIIYSEQNVAPGKFAGDGTLKYNGKEHKFTIEGMTAQGVDSNHPVEGTVYNLNNLDDLAGQYTQVKHENEGGLDVLYLQNEKGVKAVARGANKGMVLGTKASGVTVQLVK